MENTALLYTEKYKQPPFKLFAIQRDGETVFNILRGCSIFDAVTNNGYNYKSIKYIKNWNEIKFVKKDARICILRCKEVKNINITKLLQNAVKDDPPEGSLISISYQDKVFLYTYCGTDGLFEYFA